MQDAFKQVCEAHRNLYYMGDKVIPYIEEKLLSRSWEEVGYSTDLGLLNAMLGLVHDIDEDRSRAISKKIQQRGCSVPVRRRMDQLLSFTVKDYFQYVASGMNVFQEKRLARPDYVRRKIENWMSFVPAEDLSGIERLYIIACQDNDRSGSYMPILQNIVVEWGVQSSRWNPLSVVERFFVKKTLYHEVGHHAHRHTFGQDPDQEKEADKYAVKLLLKCHPVFLGSLKRLVLFIKKLKNRKKALDDD
ncbi:hypothetical protein [Emcibacter sp.]|uniref:hypothetical protein n=1 Tax=Emcibacter sp. TaxID=1979954 RepID=UPI002AA922A4|nr:hypothetical protein [Emcibacter sp.]